MSLFESICQKCFEILQSSDPGVTQPLKNGSFSCVQALVNKGQDHAFKIGVINQLNFLDILDFFKLQHIDLDIDNLDDEPILEEEKFFVIMANAIKKLGFWLVDLTHNINTLLKDQDVIKAYMAVYERVTNRALQLLDTDRARVATPLLEFFCNFVNQARSKQQMDESSVQFQQIGYLMQTLVKRYRFPNWFMEMKGYSENPDDWSDGRLDEQVNMRAVQTQVFGRICCFQPM